jgi:methyl-accepting chemotaxis protein
MRLYGFRQLPARIKNAAERLAVGDIEWNEKSRNYFASYWSLPLKFEFQTSDWTVALETSNEGAFASLGEIQKPFLLGIVASLGLSVLFAIYGIRKRLIPVELLQEGTRRIANNDFSFKVNIRSNDEFEELANSVNAMASWGVSFICL